MLAPIHRSLVSRYILATVAVVYHVKLNILVNNIIVDKLLVQLKHSLVRSLHYFLVTGKTLVKVSTSEENSFSVSRTRMAKQLVLTSVLLYCFGKYVKYNC